MRTLAGRRRVPVACLRYAFRDSFSSGIFPIARASAVTLDSERGNLLAWVTRNSCSRANTIYYKCPAEIKTYETTMKSTVKFYVNRTEDLTLKSVKVIVTYVTTNNIC